MMRPFAQIWYSYYSDNPYFPQYYRHYIKIKANYVPVLQSSLGWETCLLHNLLGDVAPAPVSLTSPMSLPPITMFSGTAPVILLLIALQRLNNASRLPSW